MAEFPSFPVWTDAYLADCSHLSDAEHGRYLQILFAMWRAPNRRLPNDDVWLARKFSRSVERVVAELRPLIVEFCQNDGNWLTQARLLREWEYLKKRSQRQSDAAKAMWRNKKGECDPYASEHTSGIAPTPTPTPNKKKEANGNGVEEGSRKKRKPRHGAKGNGRVWIDLGTSEWVAYAADYREAHEGADPPLKYDGTGTWFKYHGENVA